MTIAPERPGHLRLVRPPDPDPPASPTRAEAPATVTALPGATAPERDHGSVQGTLALRFELASGVPAEPEPRHGLRIVSFRPRFELDDDEPSPIPTPRSALPDPRRWAAQLVQAAVEATHGDRPLAQLLRWTSREVYELLQVAAAPTTTGAVHRRRTVRPVIRSLHLSEPEDGVVEACAVVHDGRRGRAVALRMEGLDGRWLCTALELG